MLINIKKSALNDAWQTTQIELDERLPVQIIPPCNLSCHYQVRAVDDYFVLSLKVAGQLTIECQRCLGAFSYPYENSTELAICSSEVTAERLMENYESLVLTSFHLDLKEVLTDELHLYVIKTHPQMKDCDEGITKIIAGTLGL